MAQPLLLENVWLQQQKFEDAERLYRQLQAGTSTGGSSSSSLAGEIALARQEIQKTLNKVPVGGGSAGGDEGVMKRLAAAERRLDALEKENKDLKQIISKFSQVSVSSPSSAAPAPADDDDDDDSDLDNMFDDEEVDEEAEALKKQRLKEYAERKSKKPAVIAKSSVVLDVKPWDDETDMKEMEKCVRTIQKDGLVWGTSKLQDVGYGIKKLVIMCVVEDLKVSIDELQEKITEDFEDHVQSVDIAAFSKI